MNNSKIEIARKWFEELRDKLILNIEKIDSTNFIDSNNNSLFSIFELPEYHLPVGTWSRYTVYTVAYTVRYHCTVP